MGAHHHHHHDHAAPDPTRKAFAVGVVLNLVFVAVEVVFGLRANSLSLLADAGHNFSDVIGLLLAWWAMLLAQRVPSEQFTYGLRSSTILAALGNAMLLVLAVGGIAWEALHRLAQPEAVSEQTMMGVAAVGVVINVATALMLLRGNTRDVNLRAAFIHMLADALVSLGVVLAGAGIYWTGWLWLDPAISLVVAVVIFAGTWSVLKTSLRLSLHAVPEHINSADVLAYLEAIPGVEEVHDLHIWGMSTTEAALTVHLVMPGGHPGDAFLAGLAEELRQRFRIEHATFQIELGNEGIACRLAPEEVV
ncbi:MAG TPA: cation diffusion facilitator family transporter [Gallionellaceae bacterium]|nr:cation diffusion facilitator family transporter [Gallionellaceae bacterium]